VRESPTRCVDLEGESDSGSDAEFDAEADVDVDAEDALEGETESESDSVGVSCTRTRGRALSSAAISNCPNPAMPTAAQVRASKSIKSLHLKTTAKKKPHPLCSHTCGQNGKIAEVKKRIIQAAKAVGMNNAQTKLALSIAMQESETLSKHDGSKSGSSANWSIFNMNSDMIGRIKKKTNQYVNYKCKECKKYNGTSESAIKGALKIMKAAIKRWGASKFLWFLRGGGTGFDAFPKEKRCVYNGKRLLCEEYVRSMGTYLTILDRQPEFMTNDLRVCIDVQHV